MLSRYLARATKTWSNVFHVTKPAQQTVRMLMSRTPASTANIFQDFLKGLSADFDINDACGCSLTTEPVTGRLIGRETELTQILGILSDTLGEDSRYPVIQMTAPPGSGKSATLQELARIFLDQTEDRRGYGEMFSKENKVREFFNTRR